jgi:hypothetical protein
MYQTGKYCAQRYEMRQERNGNELCGGVAVTGVVGSAFVGVRMSDKLSVNNVRVNKTSDTYHVTAKEYKQETGREPFFVTYRFVHAIHILF